MQMHEKQRSLSMWSTRTGSPSLLQGARFPAENVEKNINKNNLRKLCNIRKENSIIWVLKQQEICELCETTYVVYFIRFISVSLAP